MQLITDVLSEAEAGGSGVVSRRLTGQSGADKFVMKIPNNKVYISYCFCQLELKVLLARFRVLFDMHLISGWSCNWQRGRDN